MFTGALVAVLAVLGMVGTPALVDTPRQNVGDRPVLTMRTTVAGASAPTLVQGGSWMRVPGGWRTSFRSQSVAGGVTRVHVRYRSPTSHVRDGQRFFSHLTDITIDHQSAPTSSAVELDATRVCVVGEGCEPWFELGMQPPSHFDYLPFTVSTEDGWGPFEWKDKPARIYVDWSWTWRQNGVDLADVSIETNVR